MKKVKLMKKSTKKAITATITVVAGMLMLNNAATISVLAETAVTADASPSDATPGDADVDEDTSTATDPNADTDTELEDDVTGTATDPNADPDDTTTDPDDTTTDPDDTTTDPDLDDTVTGGDGSSEDSDSWYITGYEVIDGKYYDADGDMIEEAFIFSDELGYFIYVVDGEQTFPKWVSEVVDGETKWRYVDAVGKVKVDQDNSFAGGTYGNFDEEGYWTPIENTCFECKDYSDGDIYVYCYAGEEGAALSTKDEDGNKLYYYFVQDGNNTTCYLATLSQNPLTEGEQVFGQWVGDFRVTTSGYLITNTVDVVAGIYYSFDEYGFATILDPQPSSDSSDDDDNDNDVTTSTTTDSTGTGSSSVVDTTTNVTTTQNSVAVTLGTTPGESVTVQNDGVAVSAVTSQTSEGSVNNNTIVSVTEKVEVTIAEGQTAEVATIAVGADGSTRALLAATTLGATVQQVAVTAADGTQTVQNVVVYADGTQVTQKSGTDELEGFGEAVVAAEQAIQSGTQSVADVYNDFVELDLHQYDQVGAAVTFGVTAGTSGATSQTQMEQTNFVAGQEITALITGADGIVTTATFIVGENGIIQYDIPMTNCVVRYLVQKTQ